MKILSCFDGISACQQAFKNMGIEFDGVNNIYYSSEIDKYATQNTQHNFPNTVQLGDVKNIRYCVDKHLHWKEKELHKKQTIYQVDLLVGGFPCQDLSSAKKDGKGLDGERSGLFYELLRIIKEVKPRNILIENVASMKKQWKEKISEELGFGFTEINSALVTAQNRKRCYWVASLQQDGTYKKVDIQQPQDKHVFLKDILESGLGYQNKSHTITASYDGAIISNTLEKKQRSMVFEPVLYNQYNQRTLTGKSATLSTCSHQQTAISGQVVFEPICVASRGRNIVDGKRQDIKGAKTEQRLEPNLEGKTNCLTTVAKDNLVLEMFDEYKQDTNQTIRLGHYNKGGQGDRIYSVEGKSVCLSANGGGHGAKTGLYLVPTEILNLNIDKLYYIEGGCLYKVFDGELIFMHQHESLLLLATGYYTVRKLSVTECCRLQGFPDNFVDILSKTQGYKALGNSFTVPIIEHILSHLSF